MQSIKTALLTMLLFITMGVSTAGSGASGLGDWYTVHPKFTTSSGLMDVATNSVNGNIFLVQCGTPLFLLWSIAYAYIDNYKNIGHRYSL